jgi:putative hemolysin
MIMVDTGSIYILILSFILYIYFVISEFALLKVKRDDLETLTKDGVYGANRLLHIFTDLNKYIYTTQAGSSFTSVVFAVVGWSLFKELLVVWEVEGFWFYLSIIFLLMLISFILFSMGELFVKKMIPKDSIEKVACYMAPSLLFLSRLGAPYIYLVRIIPRVLLKLLKLQDNKQLYSKRYDKEELMALIKSVDKETDLSDLEQEIIINALEFEETSVKEVFTPRSSIIGIKKDASKEDIIEIAQKTGLSRYPIYETNLDDIMGFIHIKDVIFNEEYIDSLDLTKILRKPLSIYEEMGLQHLMLKMIEKRTQIALVYDEFGSLEGLATIEDLIEELFGRQISDEYDPSTEVMIEVVNKYKYLVKGIMELDDFNDYFDSDFDSSSTRTVGGFLIEHKGSVPNEDDEIEIDNLNFVNFISDRKTIATFQITIDENKMTDKLDELYKETKINNED